MSGAGGMGGRVLAGAYEAALALLGPALARRRRYVRDAAMRRERAGYVVAPADYAAARPRLWVHGSSVGEISALPPILAELEAALPGAGTVLSAFTDTGLDGARRLVGPARSFALPADRRAALGRALDRLRPDALVLAETELWPGLLREALARGVRIGVVNGRLSAPSAARYRALGPLLSPSLRRLAGVAAQSAADARRFVALGVPEEAVAVAGSSKFDAQPWAEPAPPPEPLAGRPVLVAGSTRPGDEELVLDALARLTVRAVAGLRPARPFLVLAPRHLVRLPEIERLIARRGLVAARRSERAGPLGDVARVLAGGGADVLLLDTLGELAGAYELGWAGVVGGGFMARGGHNLLEPAARGRAVLFGTHQRSAAGEVELLIGSGGGFACADAGGLAARLEILLGDRGAAGAAGWRARAAVGSARGAARRGVGFLVGRLGLGRLGSGRGVAP